MLHVQGPTENGAVQDTTCPAEELCMASLRWKRAALWSAMCCLVLSLHFSGCTLLPLSLMWGFSSGESGRSPQTEPRAARLPGSRTEPPAAPPSRRSGTWPVAEKGDAGQCIQVRVREEGAAAPSAWSVPIFSLWPDGFLSSRPSSIALFTCTQGPE